MQEIINIINSNQNFIIIFLIMVFILLLLWNIYLQYSFSIIKKKTRIFFKGKDAKDLEEIIYEQINKMDKVDDDLKNLMNDNKSIRENLLKCVQKVGVVRFNPFEDTGGNQSFCVALLDNHLNGVIILSLYSRDGVRVYSKAIKEGKSEYKLSEEEYEAIRIAKEK